MPPPVGICAQKRRDYALAIQGAALAILYLTALAALKLHALLDPPVAFALMTATTALLVALAVVQNARVLAQIAPRRRPRRAGADRGRQQ